MDKILAPIKQRVLLYAKDKGIEKKKFFEEIDVSASNFRSKSLFSEVGGDVIAKISSRYPEIDIGWLVTGKGDMLKDHNRIEQSLLESVSDQDLIPLFDLTANTDVTDVFTDTNQMIPTEHLKIPGVAKCDGAIHLTDDSMYPLLNPGDLIAYKLLNSKQNIFWGDIHVVYIIHEGDEIFSIKYIHPSDRDGYIRLVAFNERHADKEFPIESVVQIAHVKAWVRVNSRL